MPASAGEPAGAGDTERCVGLMGGVGRPGGGSHGFGSANATLEGSCFPFRSSQAAQLSIFFEKFVVSTEEAPQDSL